MVFISLKILELRLWLDKELGLATLRGGRVKESSIVLFVKNELSERLQSAELLTTCVATVANMKTFYADVLFASAILTSTASARPGMPEAFAFGSGVDGMRWGSDSRVSAPISRLYVDDSTCGSRTAAVRNAILGVVELGRAGVTALSPEFSTNNNWPGPYFFGNTPQSMAEIVLKNVVLREDADQRRIKVSCAGAGTGGGQNVDGGGLKMQDAELTPEGDIELYDGFFYYPPLRKPCKGILSQNGLTGIGGMTRPQVLLNQFTRAVAPLLFGSSTIGDFADGSVACHQLVLNKMSKMDRTFINAESYSRLASWAWDVGLGGDEPSMTQCLIKFQPGVSRAGEYPRKDDWDAFVLSKMSWMRKIAQTCVRQGTKACVGHLDVLKR